MFDLDDIKDNKVASSYFDYVLYKNIGRYGDSIWMKSTQQMKASIDAIEDIMSKNIHKMKFNFRGKYASYFIHKKKLIDVYKKRQIELENGNADDSVVDDAEYAHLRERFRLLMCLIGGTEHHPRNIVEDEQP